MIDADSNDDVDDDFDDLTKYFVQICKFVFMIL